MPRGGSKPGERRGGRQRGTPNKRTLGQMAALAEAGAPASLAKTSASSAKKLARDVIEEFMLFCTGMAAHYQPRPPGAAPNPNADESKFFIPPRD
jgi:hypothetical protein